jgi:glycosyltransferase involved in cell wall biosynthesis
MAGGVLAMDAPGGGEVQMLSLARALPDTGVQARLWRPWEDDLGQADCLHLFGSLPGHLEIVAAARRRGVPVALSTITWFSLESCWREPRSIARRLAACSRFAIRAACPVIPSWRRRLYQVVDLLMPNSQAEAEQLIRYFRVPAAKIRVVPNGADPRFALGDPQLFAERFGVRGFVLVPGRVEPRKNQLGLLRALRGTQVPVVVLGDVVPGHEAYYQACRREADPQVRFLGRLQHDDPLLASAYAAAGCVALASWYETPGLVALEAAMTGTPLVLPRGGCTDEYFGHYARYVAPHDLGGIREAVLESLRQRRSRPLAELVSQNFCWLAAARITRKAYEQIL